jgi:hypothetical protein
MPHFAEIQDGVVMRVIVADTSFIDSGLVGDPTTWIQTSYNTKGGTHSSGGTPLRKNYAAPGDTYDAARDAFYAPQPYPSWVLEEDTCLWHPPTPKPTDGGPWNWDESTLAWVEVYNGL